MNNLINDSSWERLRVGDNFVTPDNTTGSPFSIEAIDNNSVVITTNGGTPININRQAFVAVIRYLIDNLHSEQNPCAISSNIAIDAGHSLCVIARNANGSNQMIISYLLPLLSRMGLVNTDGNRPNTTWLS